jgi:hypothetical protein
MNNHVGVQILSIYTGQKKLSEKLRANIKCSDIHARTSFDVFCILKGILKQ